MFSPHRLRAPVTKHEKLSFKAALSKRICKKYKHSQRNGHKILEMQRAPKVLPKFYKISGQD